MSMISIIIPTYNEAKSLEDRLKRLRAGLTMPHEIIVSDDKSTDDTVSIASRYADKVIEHDKKTPSISANRNDGARAASGDILVFFDADSVMMEPDAFLARALRDLTKRPGTVAVTSLVRVLPEVETLSDRIVSFLLSSVIWFKCNVMGHGEAQGKFQMMRKADFDKIGGFREDLVTREDADIFQRLAKIGKVYCDPKLTVYHSGRRAHAIGWPRLLWIYNSEAFRVAFFGKPKSKEWDAVR